MVAFKDSRCFIVDLVNNETLVFQLAPGVIQDNKSSGIKVVAIAGVDMPKLTTYLTSGRELSFDIDFVADNDRERNEEYVIEKANFLRSLTYLTTVSESPRKQSLPVCMLIIGQFMELPIYVKRCNIKWGPFTDERMLPLLAKVSLTMIEAPGSSFVSALSARGGSAVRRGFSYNVGGVRNGR